MNDAHLAVDRKAVDKLSPFVVDLGIVGLYSEAYLSLAHRLLTGKERVDRVLTEDRIGDRAEYMAALPQLCGDVKRFRDLALQQCQEMLQSPECGRLQSELDATYHTLNHLFKRFSYQDHVLDDMLPSILESRRQLDRCFQLVRLSVDGSRSRSCQN